MVLLTQAVSSQPLASLPSFSKANLLFFFFLRHFPFPALQFGEICVYNNAVFAKVSVWCVGVGVTNH